MFLCDLRALCLRPKPAACVSSFTPAWPWTLEPTGKSTQHCRPRRAVRTAAATCACSSHSPRLTRTVARLGKRNAPSLHEQRRQKYRAPRTGDPLVLRLFGAAFGLHDHTAKGFSRVLPACASRHAPRRKPPGQMFRRANLKKGLLLGLLLRIGPKHKRHSPPPRRFSGLVQPAAYLLAPLRSAAIHPLLLGGNSSINP